MIYIGIDPGVNTGMAIWEDGKFKTITTTGIITAMVEIVEMVRFRGFAPGDVHIVIEDARKRTWLPREKSLSEFKGKAMGAGSVRRDSQIWEEFCRHYGYDLQLIPPRPGLTKWTAESFARITGWKGRTSNHARDAAMLVFGR